MIQEDIEDHLQSEKVYYNGFTGEICHMDSYMTCISFVNLSNALNNGKFTKENYSEVCKYWETVEYLSPIIKLTRLTVERWISGERII